MFDYFKLNDNELVYLAQDHNEEAINLLHYKYKPLITKKCSRCFKFVKNKGFDFEDLYQECLIGFEESINSYHIEDDVTFYTFTNICMDRQISTILRKTDRYKDKILNEAISLDNLEEENNNLIDLIESKKSNPESGLLEELEYQEQYDKILSSLTSLEECVFKLKIQNFDVKEISYILEKSPKSIYNTLQRIRDKIRNISIQETKKY